MVDKLRRYARLKIDLFTCFVDTKIRKKPSIPSENPYFYPLFKNVEPLFCPDMVLLVSETTKTVFIYRLICRIYW